MEWQIFAKGVDGKTSTIRVPPDCNVDKLFDAVSHYTGITTSELRLLYGRHQLEHGSGKTLSDYGIQNLSTVFIVLRLLGGHNPALALKLKKAKLTPLPGFITITTTEPDMISLDDDPYTKRAKMPCGHVIGPLSMTQYCHSLLDEKRYVFLCPYIDPLTNARCDREWELFLVRHVASLSQEELGELERKVSENYARKTMGVQQCPGCQTFCMRANKADKVVHCPVCSKKGGRFDFCWSCLHSSTSAKCQNPQCDGRDPRLKYLADCPRKAIVKVEGCPSLRACPSCGILIEHRDACKHMTCSGCRKAFCFICLKTQKDGRWQCGSYISQCTPAPVQTAIAGSK